MIDSGTLTPKNIYFIRILLLQIHVSPIIHWNTYKTYSEYVSFISNSPKNYKDTINSTFDKPYF